MIPLKNANDEQRARAAALCSAARRCFKENDDGKLVWEHLQRVFDPWRAEAATASAGVIYTRNGHREVMQYIRNVLLGDGGPTDALGDTTDTGNRIHDEILD